MNKNRKTTRRKKNLKKRPCFFTKNKIDYIDYKNVKLISNFLNVRKKIITRKITGVSAKYQRKLAKAVKRARYMALIPYTDKQK